MMAVKRMTDQQRSEVKKLHRKGRAINEIAAHIGFSRETVRRVIDPAYRERRKDQINRLRSDYGMREVDIPRQIHTVERRAGREELDRRIEEIPDDTRDLTGRLCGDPPRHDPRRHWCPWLNEGAGNAR